MADGFKLSDVLRRHSALKLNIDMRLKIDRTYNEIMDEYVKLLKPETCEFAYCERLGEAMSACIPEIAQLFRMEGGLLKAFELLLYLGRHTLRQEERTRIYCATSG